MKTTMRLADRRYLQFMLLAWLGVSTWFVVWLFREPSMKGASAEMFAGGVVLMALAATLFTAVVVAIPVRVAMNMILKDRRRSHLAETIQLALIPVLLVAYLFECSRERSQLAPPQGIDTLAAFAESMPPPQGLRLVEDGGRELIVWTGELSGPIDIVSGRSCYLFETNGQLIDWQPETGDGGPVYDIVRSSVTKKELTLENALNMADGAAPSGE